MSNSTEVAPKKNDTALCLLADLWICVFDIDRVLKTYTVVTYNFESIWYKGLNYNTYNVGYVRHLAQNLFERIHYVALDIQLQKIFSKHIPPNTLITGNLCLRMLSRTLTILVFITTSFVENIWQSHIACVGPHMF